MTAAEFQEFSRELAASFQEFSRELAASILAETDDLVRYANHEEHIAAHNAAVQSDKELNPEAYPALLLDHYILGASHPHDYNIPLNQWDSTPD